MLWICSANLRMLCSLHRRMVASTWACVVMLGFHLRLVVLLLLQLLVNSCHCLLEVPCCSGSSFLSVPTVVFVCLACCPCCSVLRYHIKFTVGPICCAAHLLYVTVETVLKGPDVEPRVGEGKEVLTLTQPTNQPTNQPIKFTVGPTCCLTHFCVSLLGQCSRALTLSHMLVKYGGVDS